MIWLFTATSPITLATVFFFFGAIVGGLADRWSVLLTEPREDLRGAGRNSVRPARGQSSPWYQLIPLVGCLLSAGRSQFRGRPIGWRGFAVEVGTGLLFSGYVLAAARFGCQQIDEVRPDELWRFVRVVYHLVLVGLLVAATATDFRDYVIPDEITYAGCVIGLGGAALSGQLQMVHLWVDWSQEVPGIAGPYLPGWLDAHRHLHGLAWSAAGAVSGAGLTWFVRNASCRILGRESLGPGDVTLMAMIGAFLGWQPTVFVFGLAPVCGMIFMLLHRFRTADNRLPYGPFLSAAAVIVLFSWRRLWLSSRLVFGHPASLAWIGAAAAGAMIALLVGLRIYRSRFEESAGAGDDSGVPESRGGRPGRFDLN